MREPIRIRQGLIQGTEGRFSVIYKGVPYAKPRWGSCGSGLSTQKPPAPVWGGRFLKYYSNFDTTHLRCINRCIFLFNRAVSLDPW